MGKCWQGIKMALHLIFFIGDFVTDILTLFLYYETQAQAVAILGTVTVSSTGILAIAIIFHSVKTLRNGQSITKAMIPHRFLGAMVESIPQLLINIYVLSISCSHVTMFKHDSEAFNLSLEIQDVSASSFVNDTTTFQVPTIQLVSGIFSFIGIIVALVCFYSWEIWFFEGISKNDAETAECNEDEQESSSRRAQNAVKAGKSSRPYKEENLTFDWLEKFFLFMSKFSGVVARIQIVAFAAYYLRFYIIISFFAVHFFVMLSVTSNVGRDKCHGKCKDSTGFKFVILSVLPCQFTWTLDAWEHWIAVACSAIYCVENTILLVVVRLFFQSSPYCLYSNMTEVNVVLNVACVAFAILFFVKRFGKFRALNKKTKAIGDHAQSQKQLLNFRDTCMKDQRGNGVNRRLNDPNCRVEIHTLPHA